MIRIVRPVAPAVLTSEGAKKTKQDCIDYDAGKREFEFDNLVYGHADVKTTLVAMQHGKCCYCESDVRHVSPGDVEHYRPKSASQQTENTPLEKPGYYWLVYAWGNLLFACDYCNRSCKKNFFPLDVHSTYCRSHNEDLSQERPLLIHPVIDNPQDFIAYRDEYAYPIKDNPRGKKTIEIFKLNERPELVERRRNELEIVKCLHEIANLQMVSEQEREKAIALVAAASLDEGEYAAMFRSAFIRKLP